MDKELYRINFSVASDDEIREKSVYVVNTIKYSENRTNTVYDHRGGSIFNQICKTCKQYEQKCPGHFGHIELNKTIVHPLFVNHVLNVLKIICYYCNKFLLTKSHIDLLDIIKLDGERRFNEILQKIKKVSVCFNCETEKREYKLKKEITHNSIVYLNQNQEIEISDDEIYDIFENIDDKFTLDILGGISHPKNCCLKVFPVIPPCCRPYEIVGNTIKEDDLTKQLVEIIKANNAILTTSDLQSAINNLKLKIEIYCRNPQKKVKNINNEPIKGIRERLTGKDGQLRDNLMGKRTEMSARTVIGPGPDLKLDEVGVPEFIAENISFPIKIYENNLKEVIELIKTGIVLKIKRQEQVFRLDYEITENISLSKINLKIIRNGKTLDKSTYYKFKAYDKILDEFNNDITDLFIPKIYIGDIAQRRILDNDIVLMNRQPTLWKGSMMAFKVKITKNKTFTFNLAVCKAFNSDFDGDEQNAHFPQSIESSIELKLLSTPEECLCNSANGNPIIVILQDALLGAYLMTDENSYIISENNYNDIIMSLSSYSVDYYLNRKKEIKNTLISLNLYNGEKSLRTGRSILSLILPSDFNFSCKDLKIKNGVIYSGRLNKEFLGSTKNSLIFILKHEYSSKCSVNFINDIQFMINKWLLFHSFSINLNDCKKYKNLNNIVLEKLLESEFIESKILNKHLAEAKINIILSNAKDVGIKIANEEESNFIHTINSGSKGDFFNLGQVKGLLGQQIINGRRIQNQIDNCQRTLIHYPRKNLSLFEKYESRGFIKSSFYEGLNPKEFFFHAMSGRQGVIDTAMTTFMSGYNMRKLVKLTEDIKIQNDGVVVDSFNNIYSYIYGDLGFNTETNLNLDRIITRINNES